MVDFLMDGNYLDAAGSRQLTAELLSFNPNLRVLGYMQLQFAWQAHGAITGGWLLRGVAGCAVWGCVFKPPWLVENHPALCMRAVWAMTIRVSGRR
jgi:hypothetical protein